MTISCGTARRILWPDAGLREASQQVIEAREHIDQCTSCEAFFTDMNGFSSTLLRAAREDAAPLEVRERLFAAIADARTQRPRRRRAIRQVVGATVAAALLVAAALTARRLTTPVSEQSLVATIARDHGQWLHGGGINSAVQNDVSHWIATRVPYGVEVPVFPSARLRGGRIATIQGNQAAVMEYDLGGSPLSYFVLRMDDNISGERIEQLTHSRREGYEVVLWREPGFLHVLVARISPSILDQLAMMCIEKSRKVSSLPHDSRLES